jgi:hypothetical protein
LAVPHGISGAAKAPVAEKARKAAPAIPTLNIFFIDIVISTNMFNLLMCNIHLDAA